MFDIVSFAWSVAKTIIGLILGFWLAIAIIALAKLGVRKLDTVLTVEVNGQKVSGTSWVRKHVNKVCGSIRRLFRPRGER